MKFEELGLSAPILRAVAAEGYTIPTPIQGQAIPHVLSGRDLLGCAQTGTGKTAAFALPILHRLSQPETAHKGGKRRTRVLILSPTRELALQIGESFHVYGRHTGLRHVVIFGGVNQNPQTRALHQGVDIVIATPGRLCDLMNQGYVDLNSIEVFVLDEADRMFDMGFLPDLRRVIAKLPNKRQTLFFSATMPEPIEKLANSILKDPARVRIAPVKAVADLIEESVAFIPQAQKSRLLIAYLKEKNAFRTIVFTKTKHGADRVTRNLSQAGIRAEAIHGNKSQAARQRALSNFKTNRTPVLVATDIAARGIDVDSISHVVNFDIPHEPETYVHRIGRTGRAGAKGVAIAFCDGGERRMIKAIERLIRRAIPVERDLPELGPQTEQQEPRRSPRQPSRNDEIREHHQPHVQPRGPSHGPRPPHAQQKPNGRPAGFGKASKRPKWKKRPHAAGSAQ